MPGFRKKFICAASRVVNALPISVLQKLAGQNIVMPFYHAVSDVSLPHISQLYSVKTVEQFKSDLNYLLAHFDPISITDLQDSLSKDSWPEKPSFLLSFDDGLSEFYDVVAPILLQKGVPAICFLNSGFIDNKEMFFRYKASLLIGEFESQGALKKKLPDAYSEIHNLKEYLLGIDYQKKHVLDEIADAIGFSFEDFLNKNQPYLTTAQIERLIAQGFYFGAHSIDHPEYRNLEFDEQLRQTKVSVKNVCNRFNIKYKAFSFPFTDFNVSKQLFDQFSSKNIVDISFGCAGQRNELVDHHFQRIAFEMESLSGQKILKSELLYFLLKMPFGKNDMIHR